MIKAVIFDLDDTLISEKEYIKSGYQSVSKVLSERYKLSEKTIYNELQQLFRESARNVFNRWMELHTIPYTQEDIKEIVALYREHKPNLTFFDDVLPTVKYLKEKGIKIGIISDGYLSTQKKKADAVNADQIFDKIILTEELGRKYWKPHPKSFEIMKSEFEVQYDEMMYVGDNPQKDFYINKIYPIQTVRIYREGSVYQDAEYYEGIHEKIKIASLRKLQELI